MGQGTPVLWFVRANLLARLFGREPVRIAATATVHKLHTLSLHLVEAPARNDGLAWARHDVEATVVNFHNIAALHAGCFGFEVVTVATTPSPGEALTRLGVGVEGPSGNRSITGAHNTRLLLTHLRHPNYR